MRLTVLADNMAVVGRGEWGFSCLIEADNQRVLLDVGGSGLFTENARTLGVDLLKLDYVVLSHGHWDHTWGLDALIKQYIRQPEQVRPTVLAHPLAFNHRTNTKGIECGTLVNADVVRRRFPLRLCAEPLWLSDRLLWLGEIERRFDFEQLDKPGIMEIDGNMVPDYIVDDSALAYKANDGLVVITGCSHSGICNIIEQARRLTGEERILDVVGGTHLIDPSPLRMNATLDYMAQLAPQALHTGHCTSLSAKVALGSVANLQELAVGLRLEYQG